MAAHAPAAFAEPAEFGGVMAIGGSAGALEALLKLVAELPRTLRAPVFVVVHISPSGSVLPEILQRRTSLRVCSPFDGEPIGVATIYVAPPDQHMMVDEGAVRLNREPRENGHRPAVDPLFRSVAGAYGALAVGVVLSGNRDDGSAGLVHIKAAGGIALVQDPELSLYDGMPRSAIDAVDPDGILDVHELAVRLAELAERRMPADMESTEPAGLSAGREVDPGSGTRFTCPDCGGVLFERREGTVERFACSVGHVYSADALESEQAHGLEGALWAAVRGLEDRAVLLRRLAARSAKGGHERSARNLEARARDHDRRAATIRGSISRPTTEEVV